MDDEAVEVIQADRDAAADYWLAAFKHDSARLDAQFIREGRQDKKPLVQAFARHRIRAMLAFNAPPDGEREALFERAERAWQRFFYPANDCFDTSTLADKLPFVDLEVADCLRLVLAHCGFEVRHPETRISYAMPEREAIHQGGREAIARAMYERFAEENGGFWDEEKGSGFGTWEQLIDKEPWRSAAGYMLNVPLPTSEKGEKL